MNTQNLSTTLQMLQNALDALAQGDHDRALDALQQADAVDPGLYLTSRIRAMVFAAAKEVTQDHIREQYQNYKEAQNRAGRARFDMGLAAATCLREAYPDGAYQEYLMLSESPDATEQDLAQINLWIDEYIKAAYRHGQDTLNVAMKWFNEHVPRLLEQGFSLRGARVLEIGGSIIPAVAMLYLCCGARVHVIDKFRTPDNIAIVGPFKQILSYRYILDRIYDRGLPAELVHGLPQLQLDDVVKLDSNKIQLIAKDLDYQYGVDAAATPFEDASMDLITSTATLEHVGDPDGDPGDTVREIARLLRPGGWSAHRIDLRDHRENRPNLWGFLRFSTREWRDMDLPMNQRANRWRMGQWRSAFTAAGLEEVACMPDAPDPAAPFTDEIAATLHPEFRDMDPQDVQVTGFTVIHRKKG